MNGYTGMAAVICFLTFRGEEDAEVTYQAPSPSGDARMSDCTLTVHRC